MCRRGWDGSIETVFRGLGKFWVRSCTDHDCQETRFHPVQNTLLVALLRVEDFTTVDLKGLEVLGLSVSSLVKQCCGMSKRRTRCALPAFLTLLYSMMKPVGQSEFSKQALK